MEDNSKIITALPKCAIDSCNNPGFVYAFGKIICGECLVKMSNRMNERAFKELENGE